MLKADGLAAGKGVLIIDNLQQAKDELRAMVAEGKFGAASSTVVIEEFLEGIELSVFVLTDGDSYKILPSINGWSECKRRKNGGMLVSQDFSYSSDNNKVWMKPNELNAWIKYNSSLLRH